MPSIWTTDSSPSGPLRRLEIDALPTKDQVIPADKAADFAIKLDVKNWKTAQGDAQSAIKQWDGGSNTAPNGAGGAAAIAVTAPAGISFATSKAIVSYAATNIDTVAQQHLQPQPADKTQALEGDVLVPVASGKSWDEKQFTGTGFPNYFYLRYHLYRHYFPMMALGRFLRALEN